MKEMKPDYRKGRLPEYAPLALAYVPMQCEAEPTYDTKEALNRGTLFPGLDLPFMNIVNQKEMPDTPMCELMAIDFVCHELILYLDTHKDDREAFENLKDFMKLAKEARKRYTEMYGPLTHKDLENMGSFAWLNDPWPWNYNSKEGK